MLVSVYEKGEGDSDTETRAREKGRVMRGSDGSDAAASQGLPAVTRNAERGKEGFCPRAYRGSMADILMLDFQPPEP